jgi:predicted extracellular nuclease
MPIGTIVRYSGTLMLLLLFSKDLASQRKELSSVRMMFYNVENFFDIYDDSLRDDNDFLPDGTMHWNYTRYNRKVQALYKVIISAGEWEPPALIGLCEVEKRGVLEDLIKNTYLAKYDYDILHQESADERGIDVCLIFRKKLIDLLGYQYILPADPTVIESRTRSVLYTKWLISGDTVHLFLNHWQSRRGGVLRGESNRESFSRMLHDKADSLMKNANGRAKIIIAGDFNCTPEDKEIEYLMKGFQQPSGLINLSLRYSEKGEGSYRYMGAWEMLDQVMVSEWLIKSVSGLSTSAESFSIFKPEFLLYVDPRYPGKSPFPTYHGYRYQGGFSDHLPVLLELWNKNIIQKH